MYLGRCRLVSTHKKGFIMYKKHRYSIEQVQIAAKQSKSYRNVLKLLKVVPAGGNYQVIKSFIKKNNIDISHFTGRGWNAGKVIGPRKDLSKYLSNELQITSHKLRLRLLKDKIFEHKCYLCNNSTWQNQPIPLELHHLNGNHLDNNLKNLTLICPNCHSFTPNHKSKKRS